MNQLVKNAKQKFWEIKELLEKFPEEKRGDTIFFGWSLRDIVAHLSGWALHDISLIESLIKSEEPRWEPDIDEFNAQSVNEREGRSWADVYTEFVDAYETLLEKYRQLPADLWQKKFWRERTLTPEENLQKDIEHLEEHRIQVLEALSSPSFRNRIAKARSDKEVIKR
jgi:hypothetical protein